MWPNRALQRLKRSRKIAKAILPEAEDSQGSDVPGGTRVNCSPAGPSRLQSLRTVRRVPELGPLAVTALL